MIPIMKKLITGAAVILLLLIEISSAFAQGALMINPKRCVFEGNKRNDVVTLYNDGEDTTSYVISFKHYEMLQNGDFREIPDSVKSDLLYCDNMVKYFPKEVTLAPHAAQTVRLQVLKPKDLVPGEYRSHLYFRAVERAKALENKRNDTDKTITLSLKAIYGLAIPIIVRTGTTPAKVSLSELTLSPADTGGNAIFSVDINRIGNES